MNKLLTALKNEQNYTHTENGALTYKSTMSALLDMFAMGAAMRSRSEEDIIVMFIKAYKEDPLLALRMLFYMRDIRHNGQGERRFFRVIIKYMANSSEYRDAIAKNMIHIPEFGRWDDLYEFAGTPLEKQAFDIMHNQFQLDMECKTPSLLGKWLKSINTSSEESRELGQLTRLYFGLSERNYRKALASLRAKINVVECLMSANRWDEIEFDKIPSRAGLIYKNAFARRDIIKAKYENFAKSENTTVNSKTLYPYEVIAKVIDLFKINSWYRRPDIPLDNVDRLMINKYWDNLKDYFDGATLDALCVIDTSGSMVRSDAAAPINIATSIGLYCAERNKGPWHNTYISFSRTPRLVETNGVDFCDKVVRIVNENLCENTNIEATFDLILHTALKNHLSQDEIPKTLIIISDLEFDEARQYSSISQKTLMEQIEDKWNSFGYKMPNIIFWNVDARHDNIPMKVKDGISFVSGCSPAIFTSIMTGKTGVDLMLEAINASCYQCITL